MPGPTVEATEPNAPGATLAVRCRGVVKTFGEGPARVTALAGVDVDVPTGRLFLLVGPSGCGKTTLISVIAGTLDSDGGEVTVFGERLDAMRSGGKTRFRRRNVGFIFQQYNLLPALTAVENVSVPLILNGVGRREAHDRAAAWLERVGLGTRLSAVPSALSGGQQQRVAVARAMVHDPRLIVCDEPTSALDGATGHKILELLREIALQDGRGIIIVTHDNRIFEFADVIAHMDDGRIVDVVRQRENRP